MLRQHTLQQRLSQYLYFCTSKASKMSTSIKLAVGAEELGHRLLQQQHPQLGAVWIREYWLAAVSRQVVVYGDSFELFLAAVVQLLLRCQFCTFVLVKQVN